ncbi:MAG: hypothetical protein WC460_00380 [Patescibacteria group bacterium]
MLVDITALKWRLLISIPLVAIILILITQYRLIRFSIELPGGEHTIGLYGSLTTSGIASPYESRMSYVKATDGKLVRYYLRNKNETYTIGYVLDGQVSIEGMHIGKELINSFCLGGIQPNQFPYGSFYIGKDGQLNPDPVCNAKVSSLALHLSDENGAQAISQETSGVDPNHNCLESLNDHIKHQSAWKYPCPELQGPDY